MIWEWNGMDGWMDGCLVELVRIDRPTLNITLRLYLARPDTPKRALIDFRPSNLLFVCSSLVVVVETVRMWPHICTLNIIIIIIIGNLIWSLCLWWITLICLYSWGDRITTRPFVCIIQAKRMVKLTGKHKHTPKGRREYLIGWEWTCNSVSIGNWLDWLLPQFE